VRANKISVDADLSETMLLQTNDKPGIIGSIGTAFAKRGSTRRHVFRPESAVSALWRFSPDEQIGDDMLNEIRSLANAIDARRLNYIKETDLLLNGQWPVNSGW
jgi:hypothetical protein